MPFYPLSSFSVPGHSPGCDLNFPSFLHLSNNFFHQSWLRGGARRIKNVVMVMEWDCDPVSSQPQQQVQSQVLSQEQEQRLQKAFDLYSEHAMISLSDVYAIVKSVGTSLDCSEDEKKLVDSTARVDFMTARTIITSYMAGKIQPNRHTVALSLAEAETVRRSIHLSSPCWARRLVAAGEPHPLEGRSEVVLGLRHGGGKLLDCTSSFEVFSGNLPQQLAAEQSLSFFNSDLFFQPHHLDILLRALETNSLQKRKAFFLAVKACRRRSTAPWEQAPIAKLFTVPDQYYLLGQRAKLARLRSVLKAHDLKLYDAFQVFDNDRSGYLGANELFNVFSSLGVMNFTPADLREFVTFIDSDGDGRISYSEFKAALEDGEATKNSSDPAGLDGHRLSRHSLGDEKESQLVVGSAAKITDRMPTWASKLTVRVNRCKAMDCVWKSEGCMSLQRASVWTPRFSNSHRQVKKISLGHYMNRSYIAPSNALLLEFRGPSDCLENLSQLVPHPTEFICVWQKLNGKQPLYVWLGVPPSSDFVALGMLATTSTSPPALEFLHCVPKRWLIEVEDNPKEIWNDRGVDIGNGEGEGGSFWGVNELGLLVAKAGYAPPPSFRYDFIAGQFTADSGV
mmetsp:Transcript_34345/g.67660  ORF Transcript_34345/g.67660 Transcript_34345/m.67660 type:complete len:622 (+) Transcript_34345:152-2017(+)